MLKRRSLERRLFGWLFALSLFPALVVMLGGIWLTSRALDWSSSLVPWERVADSGRELLQTIPAEAPGDSALTQAAERHRAELQSSLVLAKRWAYVQRRILGILPRATLALAVLLAVLALVVSRRISHWLTRPIDELVGWTDLLAREAPLPEARAGRRDLWEIEALRSALRRAAAERVASRRRAIEAERTRVWGEMARRVAHEMKNPLTPLRLAAHRLAGLAAADAVLEEPVSVIEQETERLEDLAARFSDLGRPPEGPTSEIDVGELLSSLAQTDVPSGVRCEIRLEPDVPLVNAHYDALLRAYRNLLRNAVEATEGRAARTVLVSVAATADAVEACIEDSGPGLPDGVGDEVFQPDFSTKSNGTGLGLAIVRQAIRRAGGDVAVGRSAELGGARFTVRVPTVRDAPLDPDAA